MRAACANAPPRRAGAFAIGAQLLNGVVFCPNRSIQSLLPLSFYSPAQFATRQALMMLCDTLLEARGNQDDQFMLGAVTALGTAIQEAERLELSPAVVAAAKEVKSSRPASIATALPLCRFPHRRTWIEWIPSKERRSERDTQPIPRRIGVLIDCIDTGGQFGGMTFAWQHSIPGSDYRRGITICPVGAIFDWSPRMEGIDRAREMFARAGVTSFIRVPMPPIEQLKEALAADPETRDAASLIKDKADLVALSEDFKRLEPAWSPFTREFIKALFSVAPLDRRQMAFDLWQKDLAGEIPFMRAVTALLNSRTCITLDPAELGKLNRVRQKRGLEPRLSYSIVNITLTPVQRRRLEAAGVSDIKLRQHLCRGHFKVRKTGIFWWAAHLRGDPSVGEVRHRKYVLDGGVPAG